NALDRALGRGLRGVALARREDVAVGGDDLEAELALLVLVNRELHGVPFRPQKRWRLLLSVGSPQVYPGTARAVCGRAAKRPPRRRAGSRRRRSRCLWALGLGLVHTGCLARQPGARATLPSCARG